MLTYVDQQIAVDGVWCNMRAVIPLKYPGIPPNLYTALTASIIPFTLIPFCWVFNWVLQTSRGVVHAAATAPANAPAKKLNWSYIQKDNGKINLYFNYHFLKHLDTYNVLVITII